MTIGKRIYWAMALVAVFALAGAAVTMASGISLAGNGGSAQTCEREDDADETETEDGADDAEDADEADTDDVEEECEDEGEGEGEGAGRIDDGAELLPQATVTLEQAIAAAQSAASGDIGEVDLEQYHGRLVFNVDVGDSDVKVDAATGEVLGIGDD